MGWLIADGTVRRIDADSVELSNTIPTRIWKLCFHKMIGSFLDKGEINLAHGKIYGESQSIADHIVAAYERSDKTKNLGVLMSGGKGLGKSLTTKLVIEQLKDKYPVILINEYTPDLPDFLNEVEGCVIVMDEFEKTISSKNGENDSGPTCQESLLSVLDGTSGKGGNLFILTCNNTGRIDDNMKSRPGRIRYHYKFDTAQETMLRNYCEDKLNRKDDIDELVSTLLGTRYVSMDIISAVVDELNTFPEIPVEEVMKYFNVEVEGCRIFVHCTFERQDGTFFTEEDTYSWFPGYRWDDQWYDNDTKGEPCLGTIAFNTANLKYIPMASNLDITRLCKWEPSDYAKSHDYKLVKVMVEDYEYHNAGKYIC